MSGERVTEKCAISMREFIYSWIGQDTKQSAITPINSFHFPPELSVCFRLPVQLVNEEDEERNVDEGHEDQWQQKGDN